MIKQKKRDRINDSLNQNFDFEEGHFQILDEIESEKYSYDSYMGINGGFNYYDGDIRDSNWYFFQKNIDIFNKLNEQFFLEIPTFEQINITDYLYTVFILVNKNTLKFNNPLLKRLSEFDFDLFAGFIDVLFVYNKENWNNLEELINFKIAFNVREKQFNLYDDEENINCYLFNSYVKHKRLDYLVVENQNDIKNNLSILKMLDY
jgi:hypothetical protein